MMIRAFLFFLIAGGLGLRGSEAIPAPSVGVSASVRQPHVTAELISETTHVEAGKPFLVALHLKMDEGWHTYWINFGDAGLPTKIDWTLPPGFTAGPLQWPTPEIHMMGGLTTFGYAGDVYLLTTITPPAAWTGGVPEIKAKATWLVCQEECIPGKAEFDLKLDGKAGTTDELSERLFAAARARLPVPNTRWEVKAAYGKGGGTVDNQADALWIQFTTKQGQSTQPLGKVYFFPEQTNVLSPKEDDNGMANPDQRLASFELPLDLQQNGDKPAQISGILVSDHALIGDSKSVYISAFPTDAQDIPMIIIESGANMSASGLNAYSYPTTFAPSDSTARRAAATTAQPWLVAVLGAAFLGGMILNLMPCVLPVLSLKVFSLMRHAGENPRAAWRQGAAFTVGVVISFWVLAGLLLTLRSAGNHLGWGFQMQSPGFVLALIFLFFLLALNLFGVFELGTSLVGLDAKATGRVGNGLTSSFLNGALATVAATPCTAPFMGSSLGFAAQQPTFVAMLIFTFLALGMAAPYLLLTIFPGALRFVPKPGAWMEAFKQFMGFLLLATVIFLVYVFGALVGQEQVPYLLAVLLFAGIAAWIYGKWGGPDHSGFARFFALALTFLLLAYAIEQGVELAQATPPVASAAAETGGEKWQPWTPAAVQQTLAQNRPVFVDFTAAWCLSCKVNERVALETDAVRAAFAEKNVALFRADWTHADPAISETLQTYHRDGVPLYLLYSPKAKDAPQVLPEVLTPGIVLDAVKSL